MLPGPMQRFQSEGCKVGRNGRLWLAHCALDGPTDGPLAGWRAALHTLRGISTAISVYLLESCNDIEQAWQARKNNSAQRLCYNVAVLMSRGCARWQNRPKDEVYLVL